MQSYETTAQNIIDHVGKKIVIAVPLGIGKPIGLLNALYTAALHDPSLSLTMITGLTLARPLLKNILEKNFVTPILERILKDYEDPLYEHARLKQQLPKNINVIEFFLTPGLYLHNNYVQQNYTSSAYTNVVRDMLTYEVNVIAQQVAEDDSDPDHYSLSCNSDLFYDAYAHLKNVERQGRKIAIAAEVNKNLPYMHGKAIVERKLFSHRVDTGQYRTLFSIPFEELSAQDHLIGLYASTLVKDDGCLQIGIGKLSNAVANALIMRHAHNSEYLSLLETLGTQKKFSQEIQSSGGIEPFTQGLYASTEMLSDEYLALYKANIIKKQVYDHVALQRLLNRKKINAEFGPDILDILVKHKIIHTTLTESDVSFLKKFGILKSEIQYQEGYLHLSGEQIPANLLQPDAKERIVKHCLGTHLRSGKIIHAGFFVGSSTLYQGLKNLSQDELAKIDMTTISRTNSLLTAPKLLSLQRQHGRFINTGLMITLGGVLISDGLRDYQELSGVGGQFDFIAMANHMSGARSIIQCRATRSSKGKIFSNIIWDYTNSTIPRYLRDIVVTEYGIADCRAKTDSEIIKAILNITDSRFQKKLLQKAKKSGKLAKDYEIPSVFHNNYPHVVEEIIHNAQSQGYCLPYPFGSDLTKEEQVLARVLLRLKNSSRVRLLLTLFAALFFFDRDKKYQRFLARMKLEHPKTIKEFFYKKLIVYGVASWV